MVLFEKLKNHQKNWKTHRNLNIFSNFLIIPQVFQLFCSGGGSQGTVAIESNSGCLKKWWEQTGSCKEGITYIPYQIDIPQKLQEVDQEPMFFPFIMVFPQIGDTPPHKKVVLMRGGQPYTSIYTSIYIYVYDTSTHYIST